MTRSISSRHLALVAMALFAACSVNEAGTVPCADDSSCPSDYPVCQSGKCVAASGTAGSGDQVQILSVGGRTAGSTTPVRGTLRIDVLAKAPSGVKSVALAAGSVNATAATDATIVPPIFAFDLDTTQVTDTVAAGVPITLTATVTAGDATTATATASITVDNLGPTLSGVGGAALAVSPAVGSVGTQVSLAVVSNETLQSLTASAQLVGQSSAPLLPMTVTGPDANGVYTLAYAINQATAIGTYAITAVATDLAGNSTTLTDTAAAPLEFTAASGFIVTMVVTGHVDAQGNKITISGLPAAKVGDVVAAQLSLASTFSYASGFPKYEVFPPGSSTPINATTNADNSGSFTITSAMIEGVYTFHVDVQDTAGTTGSADGVFIVSKTAPQIVGGNGGVLVSPIYVGPNQIQTQVSFTTDSSPATETATVNGNPTTVDDGTAGRNFIFDYAVVAGDEPTVGGGTATLPVLVTVADELGNESTASASAIADDTPPTISTSPTASLAAAPAGATVQLSFTVSDDGLVGGDPVVGVKLSDGSQKSASRIARDDHAGSSDFTYEVSIGALDAQGSVEVDIQAFDAALNSVTGQFPAVFLIDTTKPVIASTVVGTRTGSTPPTTPHTEFNQNGTVWLDVLASDNLGLASVTAQATYVENGTSNTIVLPFIIAFGSEVCSSSGGETCFSFEQFLSGAEPQGPISVIITATDKAGNSSSVSTTYTIDNTAPSIASDVFAPQTTFNGQTVYTFVASELVTAGTFQINDGTTSYSSGASYHGGTIGITPPTFPCTTCAVAIAGAIDPGSEVAWTVKSTLTDQASNVSSALTSLTAFESDARAGTLSIAPTASPAYLQSSETLTVTGVASRPLQSAALSGLTDTDTASACAIAADQVTVTCLVHPSSTEGARTGLTVSIVDQNGNDASGTTGAFTVDDTKPAAGVVLVSSPGVFRAGQTVTTMMPVTDCDPGTTVSASGLLANGLPASGFTEDTADETGTMGCATAKIFIFKRAVVVKASEPEGATTVQFLLEDRAGNSTVASTSYTVDDTAPSLAGALSPASATVKQGAVVTITGAASETLSAATVSTAGGTGSGTCTSSGTTFTCSLAISSSGNTTDTASVALTDVAGNVSAALGTVALNVDNTAPALVGSLSPASSTVKNGAVVVVSGPASEALSSASLSTTASGSATCTLPTATTFTCSLTVANVGNTPDAATVVLTDLAGNASAALGAAALNIDNTAPSLSGSLSPASVTVKNGAVVTITGTASEGLSAASVSTTSSGSAVCALPTSTTFSCGLTIANTGNTPDAAKVTLTDLAGNTSAALGSVALNLDNTAPALSGSLSPASVTVKNGAVVTITGTASEGLSAASVSTTSSGSAVCALPTSTTFSCALTIANTGNSTDTAKVTLTDLAGNTSAALGTVALTLDNTAPALSGSATASPSTLAQGQTTVISGSITASDLATATIASSTGDSANCKVTSSKNFSCSLTLGAAVATANGYTTTLTLTDGAGNVASGVAGPTFNVDNSAAAISVFSASTTSVTTGAGTSVTLSYTVNGACNGGTNCQILNSSGTQIAALSAEGSGTKAVTVNNTTTFTLVVTSYSGGSVSQALTVSASPSIGALTAATSPITTGSNATLNYTVSPTCSVATCTLTGPGITGSQSATGTSATVTAPPVGTDVYTLTVNDNSGSATSTVTKAVTITVSAAATISFALNGLSSGLVTSGVGYATVNASTAPTLAWTVTGGAGCSGSSSNCQIACSASSGCSAVDIASTGSQAFTAITSTTAATVTYTLTVKNLTGASTTATATVNFVAAPSITSGSFSITQPAVSIGAAVASSGACGDNLVVTGSACDLTFNAPAFTGATSAVITPALSTVVNTIASAGTNTNFAAPSSTTTYTLTLSNAAGSTITSAASVLVAESVDGPTFNTELYGATVTALGGGEVLVAGGSTTSDGLNSVDTAYVYNANTGTFTATTNNMSENRFNASAILLTTASEGTGGSYNGKVAIVGGEILNGTNSGKIDLYDPTSNSFSQEASLKDKRCGGQTATYFPSGALEGEILTVGGIACANGGMFGNDTKGKATTYAELWTPGTASAIGTEAYITEYQLNTARTGHTASLVNSAKVLIAGGTGTGGTALKSAEVFEIVSSIQQFAAVTANMSVARTSHTGTTLSVGNSGQALLAGGASGTSPVAADLFTLNNSTPANSTFTTTSGTMQAVRSNHTAVTLPSGLILFLGGQDNSANPESSTEFYDTASGLFLAGPSMLLARTNHGSDFAFTNELFIFGGATTGQSETMLVP